ncbi:MAG TPA: hypothetical protein VJ927_09300 [Actinomycetota bacterium]|nr:hypothetical protein [Actinomycetota bacterium]
MDRLTMGEKIVGAASALLVILSFLPLWAKFEASVEGFEAFNANERFGGWSEATPFWTKLAFILALVALVLVIVRAVGTDLNLPFPAGLTYVGLGGLATLLLLITLLTGPAGDQGTESFGGASFEYSRGLGMLIGWIIAAGIAVGGYMHMQSETDTGTPAIGGPPAGAPPVGDPPTTGTTPGTTGGYTGGSTPGTAAPGTPPTDPAGGPPPPTA